jgi:Domain of unknown function (DUF4041)/T5orf172 domain
MGFLLLLIAALGIAYGARQQNKLRKSTRRLEEYRARFEPVFDIDKYIEEQRKESDQLKSEHIQIEDLITAAREELAVIEEGLRFRSEDARLLEVGYHEPVFAFESLSEYEKEMERLKARQKDMLRLPGEAMVQGAAAFATQPFAVNGSDAEGRAFLRDLLSLMLRAFNGECDALKERVTYKNIDTIEKKLISCFDQINRLSARWACRLSESYLSSRTQELVLKYELEEARQREKEEQARIKEQIREEEKANREAEKARQQAEKEETKYQELLEKATAQASAAEEKDKSRLNKKIAELQARIAEIEERKRAISQAMLTKTGHVYIISNVGSFGENIFKIGMTRRLEPMDRVKELGDASVPFPFDVHALIKTSDAPALENALHKHFDDRRLNLENERKEFFRVSIEEIRDEIPVLEAKLGIELQFELTLLAEAKEYRISEAKRIHTLRQA